MGKVIIGILMFSWLIAGCHKKIPRYDYAGIEKRVSALEKECADGGCCPGKDRIKVIEVFPEEK